MVAKKYKKRKVEPDPLYKSELVAKFINHVMRKGKKALARRIVYQAFKIIKEQMKTSPLEIFEKAVDNVSPLLEVRARRIGGASYQVPIEVRPERRITLALRWIILAAKSKKGKPMSQKLAEEIMNAFNNTGEAIRKKETIHKMAEANRAFAHLAF